MVSDMKDLCEHTEFLDLIMDNEILIEISQKMKESLEVKRLEASGHMICINFHIFNLHF